jgi:hypothetical protein
MTLTCRKQSEKAEGRQGKAKQGEKMTLTTRKNNGKTEGRMNRHGSRNDAWEWAMNDVSGGHHASCKVHLVKALS